jgi:hypothetical protein
VAGCVVRAVPCRDRAWSGCVVPSLSLRPGPASFVPSRSRASVSRRSGRRTCVRDRIVTAEDRDRTMRERCLPQPVAPLAPSGPGAQISDRISSLPRGIPIPPRGGTVTAAPDHEQAQVIGCEAVHLRRRLHPTHMSARRVHAVGSAAGALIERSVVLAVAGSDASGQHVMDERGDQSVFLRSSCSGCGRYVTGCRRYVTCHVKSG